MTTNFTHLHPCIANISTSIYHKTRNSSKKKNDKLSLLPYKVLNENTDNINASEDSTNSARASYQDKFQTLLNPANHADILDNQQIGRNPAPQNAKCLKVSVVGIPNAGKSTLVNQLIGSNICPYSEKVHTTRENALGILTKDSTQIVFEDTPGIITEDEKIKFKLEESLYNDPYKSCLATDLIIVVHDVSNRYVRESISKRVLSILCRHPETPAVLVLNKLDTIPKSRRVYDLIRKLTCGRLNGEEHGMRKIKGPDKKLNVDEYFKKRAKRSELLNRRDKSHNNASTVIESYDDLLEVLYSSRAEKNQVYNETIEEICRGLVGWPGFENVFTISALHGDGIEDLSHYLMEKAYPSYGYWEYNQNLVTTKDPRRLVIEVLKSKFLDVLPHDVPYKLNPVIETWSTENGILKLLVSVVSKVPRTTNLLLRSESNLQTIAKLTEQDLQNLFHCEVFVKITVNVTHKPSSTSRETYSNTTQVYNLA